MVKHSRFAKIRENRESFPPRMFCRIRYHTYVHAYYVCMSVCMFVRMYTHDELITYNVYLH